MMTINSDRNGISEGITRASENPDNNPLGLYIHIPFCIRKCNYCDFLSFGGVPEEEQRAYFHALFQEIEYYSRVCNNKYYVDTIFIGGGTPSLVEENLIRDLMQAVRAGFSVSPDAEITIESNPKTLTERKLNTYLSAGINRLSIGAQSFNDQLLKSLGRAHFAEDFLSTYSLAKKCGFDNINIDLMFGVPDLTMGIWMDTLTQAVSLAPKHISFYSLQIEEGTPFYSMFQDGSLKETEAELDRKMYHSATEFLKQNGYLHYEISNAAKEGFRCRHNLKYWSMADYLGLGLAAHSFIEGRRFSNITELDRYISAGIGSRLSEGIVKPAGDSNEKAPLSPFVIWNHRNTREDNISEYLFTGMRKIEGISLRDFVNRFGVSLESIHGKTLEKYQKEGLIDITDGLLRFTEMGIDVSNRVLADFI